MDIQGAASVRIFFERAASVALAACVLSASFPPEGVRAAGFVAASSVKVSPSAVNLSGAALPLTGPAGLSLSRMPLSGIRAGLGGVLPNLVLPAANARSTAKVPAALGSVAAAARSEARAAPAAGPSLGKGVEVSPRGKRSAAVLTALRGAGVNLAEDRARAPAVLEALFTGSAHSRDAGGVAPVPGSWKGYGSGLRARAVSSRTEAPEPAGAAAVRKPWYRSPKPWKWIGGGALATVLMWAAPSIGHAAGLALAPALENLGFGTLMEIGSRIGYLGANAIGFIYMLPQVYRIIKSRSGKIAVGTVVTGTAASAILAFNAAYTGQGLWAFQNLMGSLSFAASIVLMWFYGRKGGGGRTASLKRRRFSDWLKASAAFAFLTGAAILGSKLLVGIVPALSFAGALVVPLQVVAALGFAFLFMPQYIKMEMEKSAGDTSKWTTIAFIAAAAGISFWALWQAALVPAGAVLANLLILSAFIGAVMLPSHFVLRGMARIPWQRLPEQVKVGGKRIGREAIISALSLVILAAYMAAVFGLGVYALNGTLVFAAEGVSRFWMYLLYVVENIFAALVSVYSLQAHRRYRAAPQAGPSPAGPSTGGRGIRREAGRRVPAALGSRSRGLNLLRSGRSSRIPGSPKGGSLSLASAFYSSFSPATVSSVAGGLKSLFRRYGRHRKALEEGSVVQVNEWSCYLDIALKLTAFLAFLKPFLAWELVLTLAVLKGDLDLKRFAKADPSRARASMRGMFLALAGLMAFSLALGLVLPALGAWGGVLFSPAVGLAAILLSAVIEGGMAAFDRMAARKTKDPILTEEARGKLVDASSTLAAAGVVLAGVLFGAHSWLLEAVPVVLLIIVALRSARALKRAPPPPRRG